MSRNPPYEDTPMSIWLVTAAAAFTFAVALIAAEACGVRFGISFEWKRDDE